MVLLGAGRFLAYIYIERERERKYRDAVDAVHLSGHGCSVRVSLLDPVVLQFEPSLDTLSLRSDVIRPIKILSLFGLGV